MHALKRARSRGKDDAAREKNARTEDLQAHTGERFSAQMWAG
jgi:hypothetical protein